MDQHAVTPANNHAYSSIFQGTGVEDFKKCIQHHLMSFQGRDPDRAGDQDVYRAVSYALRDVLMEKWIKTQKTFYAGKMKRVYYLSLEFLVGRSLGNALINMGLMDEITQALEQLGYDLESLRECEEDAALGNGGLGRLASCFMDSIATMKIPAYGYGIRDTEIVMAMACDMLVPGFNNDHVINMRLWCAKASRELDLRSFNAGDYIFAVESKVKSETISKVLYPSDDISEGQELRLKQQYFFVCATFQDILRRYRKENETFDDFPNQVAVQLNDTHPSIAIPELMRILLDVEGLSWEQAWDICVRTFAYTNHTLMPEALETWPVNMLGRVLPRHLEIIYEINRRFLEEVAIRYPGNQRKLQEMSLIDEGPVRRVRMANLAIVGSHSVNGVAALHSELLKNYLFRDFDEMYPNKINSKTNGITPRRWLLKCNQDLAQLIGEKIGYDWVVDLDKLRDLEPYIDNPIFHQRWQEVKLVNKKRLAKIIAADCDIIVDPNSLFDIHVKRIHEYKRQLLNVLHVIHFYQRLLTRPDEAVTPRTIIFAGKAAPSYHKAKLIIKLINAVGSVVNNDPRIGNRLKVAFIPNYCVSLAERIIPAADLSEQISTAGTEASGTGNMKFALNGALTIGTLDGANIEIQEEVGTENIFIFGMTAEEAEYEKKCKSRKPWQVYEKNPEVHSIIDAIGGGAFSNGDTELFQPLVNDLLSENDPYLLLLDLESYLQCQQLVGETYADRAAWTKRSILNVARMGKFSSDRTIKEYAKEIWGVKVGD